MSPIGPPFQRPWTATNADYVDSRRFGSSSVDTLCASYSLGGASPSGLRSLSPRAPQRPRRSARQGIRRRRRLVSEDRKLDRAEKPPSEKANPTPRPMIATAPTTRDTGPVKESSSRARGGQWPDQRRPPEAGIGLGPLPRGAAVRIERLPAIAVVASRGRGGRSRTANGFWTSRGALRIELLPNVHVEAAG
jgi:hypothetical protein